nr:hypothetical protein [Mycobacterium lepromatosis]
MRMHVRGLVLPDEAATELLVVDDCINTELVVHADTVFDGGWIMAGLVDTHCHVSQGQHGEIELNTASSRPRPNVPRRGAAT